MKRIPLLMVLIVLSATASADVMELDDSVAEDSWLNSYYASSNYGGATGMSAGNYAIRIYRPVIRVDIPNGSGTINEVIFSLYCSSSYGYPGYTSHNYQLHSLLRGFSESQVTWNKNDSASSWGVSGGDYNPEVIDSSATGKSNCAGRWLNWTIYGEGAENSLPLEWGDSFSFLIKSENETPNLRRDDLFKAKDDSNTSQRPRLYITYSSETTTTTTLPDLDGDGYAAGVDCDDISPNVHPDAVEVCNGVDDDCDGLTDESLSYDVDFDGYTSLDSCKGTRDDCDDSDSAIHPGAAEICENGLDDDCDGADAICETTTTTSTTASTTLTTVTTIPTTTTTLGGEPQGGNDSVIRSKTGGLQLQPADGRLYLAVKGYTMQRPDGQLVCCGPDNSNQWTCVGGACQ